MTEQIKQLALVGSYASADDAGVFVFDFDEVDPRLTLVNSLAGIENPSFVIRHPSKNCFYAVSEVGDDQDGGKTGWVVAVALSPDGRDMEIVNRRPSQGDSPCHLAIDRNGRWLLASNYGGGSVVCYPILEDGRLGEMACLVQHEGSGPNKERQESPHAHSAIFTPDNRFVLVADLGIDRLVVYRFDETAGCLNSHSEIVSAPGSGPRHCAFHPQKPYLYVGHELDNMVATYRFEAEAGTFAHLQTICTVSAEAPESFIADIHVDEAGSSVYVSNRGDDSVTIFDIGEDGRLSHGRMISCGGAWPRNFALAPSGGQMLVANQYSDHVALVTIASGETAVSVDVPQASCVAL